MIEMIFSLVFIVFLSMKVVLVSTNNIHHCLSSSMSSLLVRQPQTDSAATLLHIYSATEKCNNQRSTKHYKYYLFMILYCTCCQCSLPIEILQMVACKITNNVGQTFPRIVRNWCRTTEFQFQNSETIMNQSRANHFQFHQTNGSRSDTLAYFHKENQV